jgi:hypothetical protein
MSDFFLSQILVAVTLIIECGAMQLKHKHHVLIFLAISCLFNSAHFFLLDQPTAGYIFLVSSVRFLICIRWRAPQLFVIFLSMSFILTVVTYTSYLSALGFLATVLMTTGSFSNSDKRMRLLMAGGGSVWIIHNILLWTPVGILLELVFVTSGLIGYYRHYIRNELNSDT